MTHLVPAAAKNFLKNCFQHKTKRKSYRGSKLPREDLQKRVRYVWQLLSALFIMMESSLLAKAVFKYGYDVFTAAISLSDLATDLMVLVSFYHKKEQVFFISSLVIILLAQFAYCVAFVSKYENERNIVKNVALLIILFPFAPFLSFCFYFLDDYEKGNYNLFGLFKLRFYKRSQNERVSLLKQWMQEKVSKHLGFILGLLNIFFIQTTQTQRTHKSLNNEIKQHLIFRSNI